MCGQGRGEDPLLRGPGLKAANTGACQLGPRGPWGMDAEDLCGWDPGAPRGVDAGDLCGWDPGGLRGVDAEDPVWRAAGLGNRMTNDPGANERPSEPRGALAV